MARGPVPLLQSDRPPLQVLPHQPVAAGQYFIIEGGGELLIQEISLKNTAEGKPPGLILCP